jgi:hypothetical protein
VGEGLFIQIDVWNELPSASVTVISLVKFAGRIVPW